MAKYFYDKFAATQNTTWQQANWKPTEDSWTPVKFADLYYYYSFDSSLNRFTVSGLIPYSTPISIGSTAYRLNSDVLERFTKVREGEQGDLSGAEQIVSRNTKDPKNSTQQVSYTKGNLVQADLVAEDGTYPVNGRHTDGFWYVKKGVVNTPPTKPTLNVPTTQFEHGDKHVITFNSQDAENDQLTYTLDALWNNNASNTNLYEGKNTSYEFTVPSDKTNVQFRVKVTDGTNVTEYTLSDIKPIRAVQYYWSKYKVESGFTDVVSAVPKITKTNEYSVTNHNSWGYPGYSIQRGGAGNAFLYYLTGSYQSQELTTVGQSVTYYNGVDGSLFISSLNFRRHSETHTIQTESLMEIELKVTSTPYENRGQLLDSNIQADYNAYQHGKKNPDGFWYERGLRVVQYIPSSMPFTSPSYGTILKPSQLIDIAFGASSAANISLYEVDYRYNNDGNWVPMDYNNTLARKLNLTSDTKLKTIQFRVRVKNSSNIYSDYIYSDSYRINHMNVSLEYVRNSDGDIIAKDSLIEIPRETNFKVLYSVREDTTNEDISVNIKLNSISRITEHLINRLKEYEFELPSEELINGQNNIKIEVKNEYGTPVEYSFSIVLNPNIPIGSSCLSHMKFNEYSKSTVSLAELVSHLDN